MRADVEGTIAQAVYALRMRRTRYRGLAKTFFQDVVTATAMNLVRVVDWLWEIPRSRPGNHVLPCWRQGSAEFANNINVCMGLIRSNQVRNMKFQKGALRDVLQLWLWDAE